MPNLNSVKVSQLVPANTLQCDLFTGLTPAGGAPTDVGPALRAYLANASIDNPLELIVDGRYAISGLSGPAGGYWHITGQGWDTGFFQLAGTNNDVINNAGSTANIPTNPGYGPAPARGSNVSVKNLFINGNRGNGTNGNSTSGDPRGTTGSGVELIWYFGINLWNMNYVNIEHVRFYNISAYNLMLSNCGYWTVDKCHFENVLPTVAVTAQNSDGAHISGPSNDGRITNCYGRTGDDFIPLNACEGYGGLITRINLANNTFAQSQTGIRIYADNGSTTTGQAFGVENVSVVNHSGTANVCGILLGLEVVHSLTVLDAITDITFSNCRITAPLMVILQDNFGTLTFDNCDWIGGTQANGFIAVATNTITGSSLNVSNCRIVRNTAGSAGAGVINTTAGALTGVGSAIIKRMNVNGFQVVDAADTSLGATPALFIAASPSAFTHTQLDAVDPTQITALINSANTGVFGTVGGSSLSTTGWEIPDAIAALNTPYLSSTSPNAGKLCIQHTAGTVVALG